MAELAGEESERHKPLRKRESRVEGQWMKVAVMRRLIKAGYRGWLLWLDDDILHTSAGGRSSQGSKEAFFIERLVEQKKSFAVWRDIQW